MIYIVRHGQTQLNRARVLQGRSDFPLNEEGIAQAEALGSQFRERGISFDRVYSSPLQRAVRTAELIAGKNVSIRTDQRLIEMDYGPYEGASLNPPSPELAVFFSDFVHNPAPAGMEPLADVVHRLGSLLEELLPEAGSGNILLSTHAIAMKGALEYLSPDSRGAYWSKYIPNCAVYLAEVREGKFSVPEAVSFQHG